MHDERTYMLARPNMLSQRINVISIYFKKI